MKATGQELTTGNFKGIITDYENEHGEILKMYREPRGSIYHPHLKETIPISTLTVARYKRPLWCYNKLLYNEKRASTKHSRKTDGLSATIVRLHRRRGTPPAPSRIWSISLLSTTSL
jgi:hypothetical protein